MGVIRRSQLRCMSSKKQSEIRLQDRAARISILLLIGGLICMETIENTELWLLPFYVSMPIYWDFVSKSQYYPTNSLIFTYKHARFFAYGVSIMGVVLSVLVLTKYFYPQP